MTRISLDRLLITGTIAAALLGASGLPLAEEDKFAQCADPDAARRYVKECLGRNPYMTREACEEEALEKACPPAKKSEEKKTDGTTSATIQEMIETSKRR